MVRSFEMYVDGAFSGAEQDRRFLSVNPATGEPWASIPDASAADVDRAIQAAHRAFRQGPWPKLGASERGELLRKLADRLARDGDSLGRIETTDTGKLLKETTWQAANTARIYSYYAGLADKLEGRIPPATGNKLLNLVFHEPVGVVAAIIPWNSQLQLASYKIAPALAAGNTIVVKASEDASAPLLAFARVMAEVGFPPGVFNVISGQADPCGIALTRHPLVRRIAFTGGLETARRIIPNTAHNIARLSLELGGKSPVIVFEDADLDSVVNGAMAGIFGASGQSCAAGSRLMLQDNIYDEVTARLVARTKAIRIGDPLDPATDMGPLATDKQRQRIEQLLAQSLTQGAKLLCGGERPADRENGFYYTPTIVACDSQDYPIVREELFGPVLSVLRFKDENEAIALADDSQYAFAGGVFTRDFPKALRVCRAIQAGRIWVNTYRATAANVPFGGFRSSGYGREGGIEALHDYTETKAVMINATGEPVADPFVMH
ncbi:aldehyde dehydrogenase [Limobrevibacterium gyesilva]|uniref:Aldehyde dehydrogenase n=1 Tax=Limobrevibacterium gyesilva TaxID=2991712 RepID=A0AA41YMJ7_9PROT|nr:aldehyde dehydrogenase [Limobrevibacterium gyesilva]MCW3474748.1 aldehyde dehydrogenase [Limobrevibacterium gyesilva]